MCEKGMRLVIRGDVAPKLAGRVSCRLENSAIVASVDFKGILRWCLIT